MGSKKSEPIPPPQQQAGDIYQAQLQYDPLAAQKNYGILASSEYGLQPTTQLFENTRQNVFPQETAIRDQLAQNILGNLVSPTGITTGQQEAIDTRRGQAQTELQKALRERANLSGGLYGGRAADEETRAV